jgi:hypothetical protein
MTGSEHIQNALSSHPISSSSPIFLQASFYNTLQRKMDPTTPKRMAESATPDGEGGIHPMMNSDIMANSPQTPHPRDEGEDLHLQTSSDAAANSPRTPHPQGRPRNRDLGMWSPSWFDFLVGHLTFGLPILRS